MRPIKYTTKELKAMQKQLKEKLHSSTLAYPSAKLNFSFDTDTKLKDKDNLLQLMSYRNMTSANKAIKVGKEGFEKFYNMIILTADEVPLFKRPVGGDIQKPNYKET